MWNKLIEREPKSAIQPTPPLPDEPLRQAAPAAPLTQMAKSVLGKTVKIKGELHADEELQLDGYFEGTIESKSKVTISADGKLTGNIKGVEIVIAGTVQGNVDARNRVAIRKGAHLVGDVRTAGIAIDDGAYFKGGIDIARGET